MCYSAFFVLECCLTTDDNVFLQSVSQTKWPVLEIARIEKVETMAICCFLYFWMVFQSCNHPFVSHLSGSGLRPGSRNEISGKKPWQRTALCLLASWRGFFSLFSTRLESRGYGECKQGWWACRSNGKTPWLDSGQRVFKLSRVWGASRNDPIC